MSDDGTKVTSSVKDNFNRIFHNIEKDQQEFHDSLEADRRQEDQHLDAIGNHRSRSAGESMNDGFKKGDLSHVQIDENAESSEAVAAAPEATTPDQQPIEDQIPQ